MTTCTYQVKVTAAKDIRRMFMDAIMKDAVENMNVSLEEKTVERPVSVEIQGKKNGNVFNYTLKICIEKDIRRIFLDAILRDCLEQADISFEEKGGERFSSVEIVGRK